MLNILFCIYIIGKLYFQKLKNNNNIFCNAKKENE